MDEAAVVAAPIRDGGGMRVKVVEALAAGKAVVATPLAVEGLGDVRRAARDRRERRGVQPRARAAPSRRVAQAELAERARAWAKEQLGWGQAIARYERLYAELTGR